MLIRNEKPNITGSSPSKWEFFDSLNSFVGKTAANNNETVDLVAETRETGNPVVEVSSINTDSSNELKKPDVNSVSASDTQRRVISHAFILSARLTKKLGQNTQHQEHLRKKK